MSNIRLYNTETREYAIDLFKNDGVIVAQSVINYSVCAATSAAAIARIFEMKGRTKFGPLTLGIGETSDARTYAENPPEFSDQTISELLLGMTTAVFFKSPTVSESERIRDRL